MMVLIVSSLVIAANVCVVAFYENCFIENKNLILLIFIIFKYFIIYKMYDIFLNSDVINIKILNRKHLFYIIYDINKKKIYMPTVELMEVV